jgi:hypothetical protein
MANTRRANRKNRASRKNRKDRKNRSRKNRSSRRNRRNNMNYMGGRRGLFSTVYSPVSHLLQATGEGVGAVTNTTRNMTKRGLSGVNKVGHSVTGHANAAIGNLVSRRKGSRKSRRKNRRN